MPIPTEIQSALQVYDNNKGFWRRLFRRDQAAIRTLRTLRDAEQANFLKIYQCFIENLPKPTQASYQVYQAVLIFLDNLDLNAVHQAMDQLYIAKLITPKNLEKLNKLKTNHFQLLNNLLTQFNKNQLLNPANFDAIGNFFETTEENILIVFNYIVSAVNTLSDGDCLNQENFDYIIEKPNYAANIAIVLVALNKTNLLTSANLSQLDDPDNRFLFSDDANHILWSQFKDYLNRLLIDETNQSIFDQIIQLAKQENPKTEIEHYMNQLNSQPDTWRKNFPSNLSNISTLPKGRGSQEQLLDLNELNSLTKSGTI
ncbi:hypothetical protein A1D18_02350 [Candidatus Rickettsiella isopodorum]|jgi:hypothetical protein|uniref:Uncharacterized protein n=1 Tax=Candidatus Rickettsiella isopodorum TaxID=1225476 RepID=A0A1J8NLN5_9COXI|nr:hypothetical protein [Candidatus Rickettsiella isopodorum]OIZ94966.1 hypothetical protein A1D18_02350 [Candidatus Rickettsiella isopodorum]